MRWTENKPLIRRIKPAAILAGIIWAFSATLAACILMYAWVVLSAGPVYYLGALIVAGIALGAFTGGIAAGRAVQTLGLIHGFLVGLCYGLLLLAMFIFGGRAEFSSLEITARLLLSGIAGALGGLLGINISYMAPRRPVQRIEKKFLESDLLFHRKN